MCLAYGGLQISGNSTAFTVPNAAAKYTQGWEAHAVSQHGNADVAPSTSNSRLVLLPGVYKVTFNAVVETEVVSGTSGDSVGTVSFQLYKAGTAVDGAKAKVNALAADRPQTATVVDIVEITEAQRTAGTNYVEIYASSGDASGNDIVISDATFLAERLA